MHAKSLQLSLTLCDHMDCSPPGSSVHGDSLGKNSAVGRHALLQRIFPTQEWNGRRGFFCFVLFFYHWHHLGSPETEREILLVGLLSTVCFPADASQRGVGSPC